MPPYQNPTCCLKECSLCAGPTPMFVKVTISGVADTGDCSGCTGLNGEFILQQNTCIDPNGCFWIAPCLDFDYECDTAPNPYGANHITLAFNGTGLDITACLYFLDEEPAECDVLFTEGCPDVLVCGGAFADSFGDFTFDCTGESEINLGGVCDFSGATVTIAPLS